MVWPLLLHPIFNPNGAEQVKTTVVRRLWLVVPALLIGEVVKSQAFVCTL
jgi:hypothetical protein